MESRTRPVQTIQWARSRRRGPSRRRRASAPFVISQLSKNIEKACEAARAHRVRARAISFYLKTQEFTYHRVELDLPSATANPTDILASVHDALQQPLRIWHPVSRDGGSRCARSCRKRMSVPDLFGHSVRADEAVPVLHSVDTMNRRYGRATVVPRFEHAGLGASRKAYRETRQKGRKAGRP